MRDYWFTDGHVPEHVKIPFGLMLGEGENVNILILGRVILLFCPMSKLGVKPR